MEGIDMTSDLGRGGEREALCMVLEGGEMTLYFFASRPRWVDERRERERRRGGFIGGSLVGLVV